MIPDRTLWLACVLGIPACIAGCRPRGESLEQVMPNDNRVAAGTMNGDTLTLRLDQPQVPGVMQLDVAQRTRAWKVALPIKVEPRPR